MKIKTVSNSNVHAFEFCFDLSVGNRLQELLNFYDLKEVYLSIWGTDISKINDMKQRLHIEKIEKLSLSTRSNDFVLHISSQLVSEIVRILEDSYDEITVWDCYANWKNFVENESTPFPLFSFKKQKEPSQVGNFYLNFNPYDGNRVEINCSTSWRKEVTKENLCEFLNLCK